MQAENTSYFLRLTALWAFSEALLGGLLHGLRLPVSGLILGGMAAVCISWLGRLGSRSILRAVLLVLVIKALLSPQTPLPAYFAVSLQAAAGAFFFWLLPGYRLATVFTCMFALVQSACQKLIILTILFGQSFWLAAEQWTAGLLSKLPWLQSLNLTIIVTGWLLLYALAGLFWAWLALQQPGSMQTTAEKASPKATFTTEPIKGKEISYLRLLVGLPALGLLLMTDLVSGWQQLLLRAVSLSWLYYTWLIPVLHYLLFFLLKKAQLNHTAPLQQVIDLIPATRQSFIACWRASRPASPLYRPFKMARLLAFEFQPPCRKHPSSS